MTLERPNPDALLARVTAEEASSTRGKLKVFLGACAGVGKTYAMLEVARKKRSEGVDVLAGYIESHGRAETDALMQGLEVLSPRKVVYKGAELREFDLDAALSRKPKLVLVDELAHTNAPGSRFAKRWQDIRALLDAGIDVFTTVNIQHIESQNDLVAQVTHVVVRETVPDAVLEEAHEVELVDLPPDELLQRFKEGKIYHSEQAGRASENFFRKGNLFALRQLSLRYTAERVDRQMQAYRKDQSIRGSWPVTERILVCVSPSPQSAKVVRAAKRLASRLHAETIAVYVETPASVSIKAEDRERVLRTMQLAEQLGAETTTLSGADVTAAVLRYARERNVSKIVIGKPLVRTWRDLLFGSAVDNLIRQSGELDVYVIKGYDDEESSTPRAPFKRASKWDAYVFASLTVICCSVLALLLRDYFVPANLVMVYLAGVVLVASRYGRGPSVLASFLSVLFYDFLMVPPYYSFAVTDTEYFFTFAVMLLVALVISSLTGLTRQLADNAAERERRTASLYSMSRELASAQGERDLVRIIRKHTEDIFGGSTVVYLAGSGGKLEPCFEGTPPDSSAELGVAQWVYDHKQRAGLGTNTLPGSKSYCSPLQSSHETVGVLGFVPQNPEAFLAPAQLHLFETFTTQAALALERDRLARVANSTQIEMETEKLRNALLSSVSHDLRTPLAAIKGASSLLVDAPDLEPVLRQELVDGIHEEADYINRLVSNLLEMTRLEAGAIRVRKEWQSLEEIVGAVHSLLENRLRGRPLSIKLPPDLPLIPVDAVLIQQVIFNLVDNAIKYTPPGTEIEITATHAAKSVTVVVSDHGPGLVAGEEARICDKFYRANSDSKRGGVGLGLTICHGIIQLHGGRIWAENRTASGTGATFKFTLPLDGGPPEMLPVPPEAATS